MSRAKSNGNPGGGVTSKRGSDATPLTVAKFLPVLSPYPKACPRCGTVTAEDGFAVDRSKASGRKSHCLECDRKKAATYYAAHRDEFQAQREAVREAARQAELEALAETHRERVEAAKKVAAAGARRQKELLKSLGVPDLTPEEVSERARRRGSGRATI